MNSCNAQSVVDNIVLINVGKYDRGEIARELEVVEKLNPRVIALDIAFPKYIGDHDDKQLFLAFNKCKRIVLPSQINVLATRADGSEIITVSMTFSSGFYSPHIQTGFVSAKVGEFQIPKQFIVYQNDDDYDYYHFSISTAMLFDSLRTSNFIHTHERLVDVNYKNGNRDFKIFSASDVLNNKLTAKDIQGKIVMFGYLGPGDIDRFLTPRGGNPNKPYMYGLEYLANIVAQVLGD